MNRQERLKALSEFLRSRRMALLPEEHGFPAGGGGGRRGCGGRRSRSWPV